MSWGHNRFPGKIPPEADLAVLGRLATSRASPPTIPPTSLFLAHFLDDLNRPLLVSPASEGPMTLALQASPNAEFGRLVPTLPPGYQQVLRAHFSANEISELASLAQESDPALFWEEMIRFARGLENSGKPGVAIFLLQGILEKRSGASEEFSKIRASAQRELGAILGQGASGPRMEFLLKRFAREAADPWMIAGFGVASIAFKGTKFYALSRLLNSPGGGFFTRGFGATLLASAAGLTAEVPAFVLTSKLGREISGEPQDWSRAGLVHEFAATGLTLFCLKGTGALSAKAFNALHALDPLAASPTALGVFTRFSRGAIPQLGMFGGILLGRRAEEFTGLRPEIAGATFFVDGLGTYFQFLVGGRLADRVLGPRYRDLQRDLDLRVAIQDSAKISSPLPSSSPKILTAMSIKGTRAESLQDLILRPLWMSHHDDGGKKDQGPGKVIVLRPKRDPVDPANVESRNALRPPALDPKAFAEEVHLTISEVRRYSYLANQALTSMFSRVEIYLAHHARGRAEAPEMQVLREEIVASYDGFLRGYLQAKQGLEGLTTLSFRSHPTPGLHMEVMKTRTQVRNFLEQAVEVNEAVQRIFQEIAIGKPEIIHAALQGIRRKIPGGTGRLSLPGATKFTLLSEEILFSKLAGILEGGIVKEAYRGTAEEIDTVRKFHLHPWSLLDQASPRTKDHQVQEWVIATILETARSKGSGSEIAEALLERIHPSVEEMPNTSLRETVPREILRWGGTYSDPFRTWIAIQVPALMVGFQGDFQTFQERTQALDFFMEPKTREATRIVARWLAQAVHGEGFPHEWGTQTDTSSVEFRALRLAAELESDPARLERELGKKGDMAVVGHALHAFLKHSYDARQAMETALASPEALREDVAALTGSLLGAFHGKGVFFLEWMSEAMLKSVPTRDPESAMRRVVQFADKEMHLLEILSELRGLFLEPAGKSRPTLLTLAAKEGQDPRWAMVFEAFGARYANFERIANETIHRTAATLKASRSAGLSPKGWRTFLSDLGESIHRLDLALEDLKAFRENAPQGTNDSGKAAASPRPWPTLDLKLQRFEILRRELGQFQEEAAEIVPHGRHWNLPDGNAEALLDQLAKISGLEEVSDSADLKVATDRPSVVFSAGKTYHPEDSMSENERPPEDILLEEMARRNQPGFLVQTIAKAIGPAVAGEISLQLAEGLAKLHPQLVYVLSRAASEFPTEGFAAVLHDMNVIRIPNRATLSESGLSPLSEVYYESLAVMIRENHHSLFKQKMAISTQDLAKSLQGLPEAAAELLGYWTQDAGTSLLMAKRLGLPGLPEESFILNAYQRWEFPPPSSR